MCISVEQRVCCSVFSQAEGVNKEDGILSMKNPGTNKPHVLAHAQTTVYAHM